MPSETGFGFQTASVFQKCYNPLFTGTSETMFQHAGRHLKHRPMCRPDLEGVMPLPNKV
ncbi:exodeoxyribonuclease VII [Neisseria meningitidis]|uniref:exodeoxyribonuclease VII n=1 Tax=Neisseria meningitidis TaxID=487 RepID=UPI0011875FCD